MSIHYNLEGYTMTLNVEEATMQEIWDAIEQKLNDEPEPIKGITNTYSFDLSGDEGGLFGLKITNGKAETVMGEMNEADCALSLSVKNFKKMLMGNLNSTTSYMMGKLKVKGSLGLALKLESLLKQYSF